MAITQHRSKRKISGGRYNDYRKKRVFELGNRPTLTGIGETAKRFSRGKGGNVKPKILRTDVVNLLDKNGKCVKAKVMRVVNNPANPNFTRRNIITMGAVIETDKGNARITSRPGQVGTLNAVLI